jgi:hypothetical protein
MRKATKPGSALDNCIVARGSLGKTADQVHDGDPKIIVGRVLEHIPAYLVVAWLVLLQGRGGAIYLGNQQMHQHHVRPVILDKPERLNQVDLRSLQPELLNVMEAGCAARRSAHSGQARHWLHQCRVFCQ